MSKRARSSTASPSKNKRVKSQPDQYQIDHFFGNPAAKPADTASRHSQFVQGSSKQYGSTGNSSKFLGEKERKIIDVDSLELEEAPRSQKPIAELASLSHVKKEVYTRLGVEKISAAPFPTEPVDFLPLDVDPKTYNPDSQPSNSSKAPYSLLTFALVALSQTRSLPSSLLPAVYLLSNSLGPPFVALELGLGSSIISRSIQQISGLSSAALKRLYNTTGDPGDVAFSAKSNIRTLVPHAPLSIPDVYEALLKITRCKGQGAAKEKQKIVEKLLLAASGEEVRYLTRTLFQNLRVGAVRTSIITALARAVVLTPPSSIRDKLAATNGSPSDTLYASPDLLSELPELSPSKGKNRDNGKDKLSALFKQAEDLMKQVYVKHPSYDQIIPALLENGLDSLAERVPLTVGIPLLPMLGSPMRSLDEIYHRLGDLPFSAEFKYDGQRAQIHASRASYGCPNVKIFSRHLEDMTSKYPDVISLVNSMFDASDDLTSFIMDAEIVAIDPVSGALKSFQELSGRARKDVNLKDVRVAVCVYAFDLMYLNEKSLLAHTFRERRNLLRKSFCPRIVPQEDISLAHFDFVESCESTEGRSSIEEFLTKAVENRCEGLMIKLLENAKVTEQTPEKQSRLKTLPSTYEPDLRTLGWLKLKKDYIDSTSDSLDLIPVGAWHGNGRKAQWWSPVLLALWNPETGRPVALCKCMSGFTDAFYISMKEKYSLDSDFCSKQPIWECDFGGFKPAVYFKPNEVWEIRGADITESPVSIAAHGMVSSSRGLSLRFPRFIKPRDDKSTELASTPSFLVGIWKSQQGKGKDDVGNDDGDLLDLELANSDLEYFSDELGEDDEQS
ncbi:ATP-dependent DNA ligase [Flammula alnicola]|nr:ATP-dependent DNA ligase [Flammula alnicola]